MKRIHGRPLRFLVILFSMIVDVPVLVSCQSFSVFASPPTSGDWVVMGTESYYGETFVLNGNLIVESSGNLTFRKVTLRVNSTYNGQYSITIMPGGKFYILEGSVITSESPGKRIGEFVVHENSTFRMNNSELHECGESYPGAPGLTINSDDAIVETSLFSRNVEGISVFGDGVVVRNNNITGNDIYGIHVTGCSPIIRDNYVSLNGYIGIGVYWGGSPIIEGNTITSHNETGIELAQFGAGTIRGNIIRDNFNGVHSDHSNPLVQGNIITSNRANGISCKNSSLPEIHWNDIYDNKGFDVANIDSSVTVNATYNYWSGEPSASSHILYDPWLKESIFPFALAIQGPKSGITVGLTLIVKAVTNDLAVVSRIEFYLQDALVSTVYEKPYQWAWDTAKHPNGEYTVTVKAYDTVGNVKTSETAVTVRNVESPWWQTHFWTIIQVLVAIGGLTLGIATYLSGRKKKRKIKD